MAYITAKEVAVIRADLKDAFPGWKFKVCLDSGHLGVRVHFMEGPVPLYAYISDDWARKPMADRDPSKQVSQHQINQYWFNEHHPAETARIIEHALAIISKTHWDKSDAMTDYFHCAFYIHMEIGTWEKPYVCTVGQYHEEAA
jgi:hypothetical protein